MEVYPLDCMNKRVFIILIFLILAQDALSQTYPETCVNGRLERNEIAIDCGGPCRSCTLEDLEKTQRILYPDVKIYEKQLAFNATSLLEEPRSFILSTPFSTFESDALVQEVVGQGEMYVLPTGNIQLTTFSTPSLKEVRVLVGDLIELRGMKAIGGQGESSPQFKITMKLGNQTDSIALPQKSVNYPLILLAVLSALWFVLLLFYWSAYKKDIGKFFHALRSFFSVGFENIRKTQARYLLAQLWPAIEKGNTDQAKKLLKKLEVKYAKIKKKDPTMTANLQEIRQILK